MKFHVVIGGVNFMHLLVHSTAVFNSRIVLR